MSTLGEGVAVEEGRTDTLEKDWKMKQAEDETGGVLGEDGDLRCFLQKMLRLQKGWNGPHLAAGSL